MKRCIEKSVDGLKQSISLSEDIQGETKELATFIDSLKKIEQTLSKQMKQFKW